jgi:hypothetical protein
MPAMLTPGLGFDSRRGAAPPLGGGRSLVIPSLPLPTARQLSAVQALPCRLLAILICVIVFIIFFRLLAEGWKHKSAMQHWVDVTTGAVVPGVWVVVVCGGTILLAQIAALWRRGPPKSACLCLCAGGTLQALQAPPPALHLLLLDICQ